MILPGVAVLVQRGLLTFLPSANCYLTSVPQLTVSQSIKSKNVLEPTSPLQPKLPMSPFLPWPMLRADPFFHKAGDTKD